MDDEKRIINRMIEVLQNFKWSLQELRKKYYVKMPEKEYLDALNVLFKLRSRGRKINLRKELEFRYEKISDKDLKRVQNNLCYVIDSYDKYRDERLYRFIVDTVKELCTNLEEEIIVHREAMPLALEEYIHSNNEPVEKYVHKFESQLRFICHHANTEGLWKLYAMDDIIKDFNSIMEKALRENTEICMRNSILDFIEENINIDRFVKILKDK